MRTLAWYIDPNGVDDQFFFFQILTNYWYQNCHTSQKLIFVVYVKMKKSLYTQVIIWLDTSLDHIDVRTILLHAWYKDPNGIRIKHIIKCP
jgi:hypothetical protein